MRSGLLFQLVMLVSAISFAAANFAAAAEVPGSAHADARGLLSAGDAEGAIAALDEIVAAGEEDAEALVLRGAAHEAAGKAEAAWEDYRAALAVLRARAGPDAELVLAAIAGAERCNELRAAIFEARAAAIAALEEALVAAKVAGDWEVARQGAVAILRLDPLHEGAQAFLKEYWQEPSLRGNWINLFDPSLRNTEKPEGIWEPLTDRDGYEFRPNDEVVDTGEMWLSGVDAPQDNYEVEGTFEVREMNREGERTLVFGWGRGDGSTLVVCLFADGAMGLYQQKGSEFEKLIAPQSAGLPAEEREFTLLLTVQRGNLTVSLNGDEVMRHEGIASELSGLPFLINTENTRTRAWNLRFRYRPADGEAPGKSELKEAARAVKKEEPDCLDTVDALLADSPNDVDLLLMRAEAAEALEHKDTVMAYRRVLQESAADKKVIKSAEKALKKLAAPNPITDILEDFGKAVSKARREAPRDFDAAELRVLEARISALPPDKSDLKALAKLSRDEDTEGKWTEIPLDPDSVCKVVHGSWQKTGEGLEANGSSSDLAQLDTPCTVSDAFDLSFDFRFAISGKSTSGFQVWLGSPALVWKHGYPMERVGLSTSDDLAFEHHIAKKRRDADREWHTCRISAAHGFTRFFVDGELYFLAALPPGHESLAGRAPALRVGAGPIYFRNLRYRDHW